MGDHDGGQPVGDETSVGGHVVHQVGQVPAVHREADVGVRYDRSVGRKMLGRRCHSGIAHAVHIGHRELADGLRAGMERPVPDDLAHPIIEVYTGGK